MDFQTPEAQYKPLTEFCASKSRHFFRDEQGSSMFEYTIMVTMIVAISLLAIDGVGLAIRGPISQLASEEEDSRKKRLAQHHRAPASGGTITLADIQRRATVPLNWRMPLAASALLIASIILAYRRGHRQTAQMRGNQEILSPKFSETLLGVLAGKRQEILRSFKGNTQAMFASRLHVRHLMTKPLTIVRSNTPVSQLRGLMDRKNVRHLLVSNKDDKLLGIISDRDLLAREGATAADIMTSDLVTLDSNALLSPALTQLLNHRISCLPVVEDGRLQGIVTTTDVVMALQCTLQVLQQIATATRSVDSSELGAEGTLQMLQEMIADELTPSQFATELTARQD